MKWIEAKIEMHDGHDDQVVDVISGIFFSFGLTGVVIEDPELAPVDGWAEEAAGRATRHAVTGYLPSNDTGRECLARLQQYQLRLSEHQGIDIQLKFHEIDEKDWTESWKEFFKPYRVSRDLIIKPSWEKVSKDPGTMVIDIDPGMAFGTGTHATTVLCLRLIRKFMVKGGALLDVGTGSGILAIAAAKYGAESIVAVDTDAAALKIAAENLVRNGVEPERCRMILGRLVDRVTGCFDLVVANILTDVILELLLDLHRVLEPGGIFICSGIITRHKEQILQAMMERQHDILAVDELDGWVAIATKHVVQD